MAMDLEEDTYSVIFSALKHPSRRKILRILAEGPKTYTELQKKLGIDTGYLNYYLETLDGLIMKREGRYSLSELGRSAVMLIRNVEETGLTAEHGELRASGLKFNIFHISLLFMLILSNAYWIYYIHMQNLERTNSLGNSILYTKALLDESIEIINRTIRENRILFSNYNMISMKLLQASSQFDLMKILDGGRSNHWSQLAWATGSLAEFFSEASERCLYRGYPYIDITVGQGWGTLLPLFMGDLMEIEKSLPSKIVLGNNPIVEIEDEYSTNALEAAFKLQRDIALARRALNFPEEYNVEVKGYSIEMKRR